MSLDICIKQDDKEVYNKNFYGFIHFNDSENRHKIAHSMKPNEVKDYDTFKKFILKSVESDRQDNYLNLVNKKKKITVEIY